MERKRGAFQTPTGTVQGANRLRWKKKQGERLSSLPSVGANCDAAWACEEGSSCRKRFACP